MSWGEVFEGITNAFGLEAGVVIVGLIIIGFTAWNVSSKSPSPKVVTSLLYIMGLGLLLMGSYFMLSKIGFDILIEIPKLFTCNNGIILTLFLVLTGIIYLFIEKIRYSIDVKVYPGKEQVYVNVINDGKADIVCVSYIDKLEEIGENEREIAIESSILAWRGNHGNTNLTNMEENRFYILNKCRNNVCLEFSDFHRQPLESNRRYRISISIYRAKWKSMKRLMKRIKAEFYIKESRSSYGSDVFFEIKWYPKDEK